ncbi:MAG: ribosome maturation factor RimP [Clostridiaceae bacterium]
MSNEELISKLFQLISPITERLGYELYHIEYLKEDGDYFLRIYIDNENGIGLRDCEKVSREVSEVMDVEDPITDQYYLEVSSPGIFRNLHTEDHYRRYQGFDVLVNSDILINGKRKLEGKLEGFDENHINLNVDSEIVKIPRDKIKSISLNGEL